LCCEILQLNPDLRRVWSFGGIFRLTFFSEGCSPEAPLDEPPLQVMTKNKTFQLNHSLACASYAFIWPYIHAYVKKAEINRISDDEKGG